MSAFSQFAPEAWFESRIEHEIGALVARASVPLKIELWDGRKFDLGREARVTVRILRAKALRYFVNPNLAKLGKAFIEGHVEVDGPIREVMRAAEAISRNAHGKKGRLPFFNRHTRARDTKAIRHHYDLSNEFYALWLDRRMVYSCAYFKDGEEEIDKAQAQKLDHICRKLRLAAGESFLDVGCGWGALVVHAAKHYGVQATGITLSQSQHRFACERIAAEGLEGRCRVLLQDYRDLRGEESYDKIASVGMFEHVGLKNLPRYFDGLRRLLKDGGVMLNHGITSIDPNSRTVDCGASEFIEEYVFPHGELPHISLVLKIMSAAGLEVMDVESLRRHYARTLVLWSGRLERNVDKARAHVSERHLRIWRAYLAGCAHAFENRWVSIQQVLATKTADPRNSPLPWTRDWIYERAASSR